MNDELISFIRTRIREFTLPISGSTRLEDDLGITGEEAGELIVAFAKRFNVNIAAFRFEKYFYAEPSIFISEGPKDVFTVGHLQKGIDTGYLG